MLQYKYVIILNENQYSNLKTLNVYQWLSSTIKAEYISTTLLW